MHYWVWWFTSRAGRQVCGRKSAALALCDAWFASAQLCSARRPKHERGKPPGSSKRGTSYYCLTCHAMQCEAANARAREFIKEQRDNRVNFFWHKDPPPDPCAMPPEGLPWRPAFEEWD